jgi:hypothetical protein
MNITPILTKTCIICKITKNRADFTKHSGHSDGLHSRCRACTNEGNKNRRAKVRQARLEASGVVADVDIAEPQKPAPQTILDAPELIVDVPGIYEVENRGRGTRSFNFTSTIDGSTFSFPSFAEARQARQAMMKAFRQQAVFESVVRQKTGKKPEADEDL